MMGKRKAHFVEKLTLTRGGAHAYAWRSSPSVEGWRVGLVCEGERKEHGFSRMTQRTRIFLMVGLFFVLSSGVLAQTTGGFYGGFGTSYSGSVGSWQAYQPTFNRLYAGDIETYWPILSRLESDQCNATSDFIIGIPPGGCSPSVVRSDLLEEQNVPVFCQLYAVKVNPLIKVSSIKTISFRGDYPEGVSGIAFHPARAAVKSYDTLLGDPLIENIGYVVIVLSRERVEKNMEDWISGNLTATIRYDAEEAFGTGRSEYYLPVMSDEEWGDTYAGSSFWNGRGYVRATSVTRDSARIEVLLDDDNVLSSFNLKVGETSGLMYLPGYYCRAGLRVRLNSVVGDDDSVLLNLDGEEQWLRVGSRFFNDKCRVDSLDAESGNEGSVGLSCTGNKRFTLSLSKSEEKLSNPSVGDNADKYFEEAGKSVDLILDEFPSEKRDSGEYFGEEALLEQIKLARQLNKKKSEYDLSSTFIERYPSSKSVEVVRYDMLKMNGTNFDDAYSSVYVNDKFRTISVAGFKSVDREKRTIDLRVDGKAVSVGEDWKWGDGEVGDISVSRILPGEVEFRFKSSAENVRAETISVLEGESRSFGGVTIAVDRVSVKEVAYVSLVPEVNYEKSEADFSFNIGIEKRGIELSPEKTNEMLRNLNVSIEKWEGIIDRLGNVIKGLKGACFATSGILMIKNMVTGFGGETLARAKVMESYRTICDRDYSTLSRTECYNQNVVKDGIKKDVEAMTEALNSVNEKMESAQSGLTEASGLFGEKGVVDRDKYLEALREKTGVESVEVDVGGESIKVPIGKIGTESTLRSVMLYEELKKSGVGGKTLEIAKKEMDEDLTNIALGEKEGGVQADAKKELEDLGIKDAKVQSYVSKGSTVLRWDGQTEGKDKIQYLNYNGKNYKLNLTGSSSTGNMGIDKVFVREGQDWKEVANPPSDFGKIYFSGVGVSESSCSNEWEGEASVSYYESGSDSGLPAIVPFDLENGWYAMVPNSGGTFLDSTPQGYTASGDVSYFKICNVGSNGLMQSGTDDDLCQSFNSNSVGDVNSFGGCSLNERGVRNLYDNAREAIRQASRLHDSCAGGGEKFIRILNQEIKCGAPMSEVGGFECQDFMSPEDCNLMFNVCDPVICPPSRCNLGGKMPVTDVIQTGVIGSLVLCLPNAAEGIAVPICLSGVHAGLDGYLSILKSERDCLETSLRTGEHVGICDQITSIYKCEFFWRQASPVLDRLLPSLISSLISPGQRVRGGGEYALVEHAWNNMQKSVDYFKSVYAPNAFRAFNLRSSEEIGSEFCKSFIGTSLPSSADAIESLLEPESPPQFYAQFSETLFTEATVPSTSQYKVYFHVYAGNERGVQYRVYLKNPPQTSYYRSTPSVWVDSGYIGKGERADKTVDFTAPSGYKELCVVVDAKEECGFKQVSTELGVKLLTAKYAEEQAEKDDIKTEKECMSTSPSVLSAVNLNPVQSVGEDLAGSDAALSGIVRVCATENPGSAVDEKRWKDVGICGDVKLKCWLDVDSVEDDLKTLEAVSGEPIGLLDERRGLIENGEMGLEDVQAKLSLIRTKIKEGLDWSGYDGGGEINETLWSLSLIVGDANNVKGAGTNADRAEAIALRATIYRKIALGKRVVSTPDVKPAGGDVGSTVVEENVKKISEEFKCSVGSCSDSGGKIGYCDIDSGKCKLREVLLSDVDGDDIFGRGDDRFVVKVKKPSGGKFVFSLSNIENGEVRTFDGAGSDTLESRGYFLIERK